MLTRYSSEKPLSHVDLIDDRRLLSRQDLAYSGLWAGTDFCEGPARGKFKLCISFVVVSDAGFRCLFRFVKVSKLYGEIL